MDFIDQIQELVNRTGKLKDHLGNEEATKTALVMPFLQTLGYDVFNPKEVVPEFTADHGIKKGEKVDYAICLNEQPIFIIEVKQYGADLSQASGQLYRYFSVTACRVALLTDGARFHFFTDLDEPNKMDDRPFMIVDLEDLDLSLVPELKKMTKAQFDLEQTLSCAMELKYTREIKKLLTSELDTPSEDFARFFIGRVYTGRMTAAVKEQFTPIIKRAFAKLIDERINERLKGAMTVTTPAAEPPTEAVPEQPAKSKIETTQEEIEGYLTVKAILRECCDPARIAARDTQGYMGVLLDDTNRKPICRLHLNGSTKYLGLFDAAKKEERVALESLNDIFKYADRIMATFKSYETPANGKAE
ncbi:protein of unknown function DUF450 [Solidesulfovibrio fructosivorans JJ]]|uniref:Type I restriction enzyme R protein N-terminal domain-containing protein n=1 Tax=Solidesulfovibrio fructosivorans JJ] TaxID=596151 RepID=E1JRC5_SOLFR|nr:type I restriction endonuclease [Solidesulfovibrio fructosivorans]EFL53126.1 protein of unknown function DUF450 [Solidesulfovibrio fructosivorans JJ]]